MNEYDVTLKLLLQTSADSVLRQTIGNAHVTRWLNAEMPKVQTRCADLVGSTTDDRLIHIELQSSNDAEMALRMAEYSLGIYRQFGKLPKQVVLYVGEPQLRMTASLNGPDSADPDFSFRYALFDFRDLDGAALMESKSIEDNLLAILTRWQNQAANVREIMSRIGDLEEPARHDLFAKFLILSGLRRLEHVIREEAKKMPILNDILDHQVLGPAIRQGRQEGLAEGRTEGRAEGRAEGRTEGRVDILRRQLQKRFGAIPAWTEDRLTSLSGPALDDVAVRILDAAHLKDLFPR